MDSEEEDGRRLSIGDGQRTFQGNSTDGFVSEHVQVSTNINYTHVWPNLIQQLMAFFFRCSCCCLTKPGSVRDPAQRFGAQSLCL